MSNNILIYLKFSLYKLKKQHYFLETNSYWNYICQFYSLINCKFYEESVYKIIYLNKVNFKDINLKIIFSIYEENISNTNISSSNSMYMYAICEYIEKNLSKDKYWFLYTDNLSLIIETPLCKNQNELENWKKEYWMRNLEYKKLKFNEINDKNRYQLLYPKFNFFIEEFII